MHGADTDRESLRFHNGSSELSVNGVVTVSDPTQCTKNRNRDKVAILGMWVTELSS